jgi:hypothetical protein
MRKALSFTGVVLLVLVVGCATIVSGQHQEVNITSTPTGAEILVDGQSRGITPLIVDLTRKQKHVLQLRLEGYQPYEVVFERKFNGWAIGNVFLGGLVGLGVDLISGATYKLSPVQVNAALTQEGTAWVPSGNDQVMVLLVQEAAPGWEQIGQLQRSTR